MRYFVTVNGRDFCFSLSRDGGGALTLRPEAPESSEVSKLRAELLSPGSADRPALVRVEGRIFRVLGATAATPGEAAATESRSRTRVDGRPIALRIDSELTRRARPARGKSTANKNARVAAPMPGRIVKLHVRAGQRVAGGTPLIGIEAMKMENELLAPCAGLIQTVSVEVGATVDADQELLVIEPE